MLTIFLIIVAICNVITFLLYMVDKSRAKRGMWRMSETTLLTAGFFMGSIGAIMGMHLLRHKTKHIKFKILVPLSLGINIGITIGLFVLGIIP
ncbi:MAG: DUF1294 domain-containing protein [Defluviitaleaceae bacterium]|nr:DUF1294 domain-containing protein [Defluviitaleaceae bacterium]